MKVTHVSIQPTEAAQNAGRPSLTPELLAASGARYSRNNEGLESILAKIDPQNLDKSVDGIFRMIDYGHQSIADMAPIAMFMDGITMWLAYLVWSQVPTAGGQESSTRYLKLAISDLPSADDLEIPVAHHGEWNDLMTRSMEGYEAAYRVWENFAESNPEATRIPKGLIEDPSDKAQKQVARMRRNFAFDRARYLLPVALRTNMMLVMSARGWVQLTQWLLSHYLPEANHLGRLIVGELGLSAPRLLRHATEKDSIVKGHLDELAALSSFSTTQPEVGVSILMPSGASNADLADSLRHHDNRYAYFGEAIRRTAVRVAWPKMAFAEIRDLNRHRTGTKYCPPLGLGFYGAEDQFPTALTEELSDLLRIGAEVTQRGIELAKGGFHAFPYFYVLGTEFYFEHTMTADKFVYESELRTGTGAHYRYADQMREALAKWYEQVPETKGLILEGSAEPE
ncbi:MAG: FAD-dependent thymidylate synthase [Chthonomonas sp.]|nr:FAD-dependent thymidylate synthase [Chthonomonas sp.]